MDSLVILNLLLLIFGNVYIMCNGKPNIIFMFADDIGYNDVGFTSSDLSTPSTDTITPNLNKLATEEGIIINNYYVHRMCSPSRAAFLSGRYSFRYGMQTHLLSPDYKVALTRQVSLLSEEFKAAGYDTHAIGKWHLGFQSWEYTPTYRGFNTFYGYYNAWCDYYASTYNIIMDNMEYEYFDLRNNEEEIHPVDNTYSIYRFKDKAIDIINNADESTPFFLYLAWQSSHEPNEAPDVYYNLYDGDTQTITRRFHQAQTSAMDYAINDIVDVLKANNIWDNTILVWSSDNGGAATVGDNYPLRGYKKTLFEGGLRVPAFITGGYIPSDQIGSIIGNNGEYFHVVDWYPTLLEAAGCDITHAKSTLTAAVDTNDKDYVTPEWDTSDIIIPLDGISFWSQIETGQTNNELSSRLMYLDTYTEVTSDDVSIIQGSIRLGKWKYLRGLGTLDDYDGDDGYLWGDKFEDLTDYDTHLWGLDYANLEYDNSLDCDLADSPTNVLCFDTIDGCLFNLETDPCEFNDLSGQFPEMFNYLKQKLQDIKRKIPTDIASDDVFQLSITSDEDWLQLRSTTDDETGNGKFWRPWKEYKTTEFEALLLKDYTEIYDSKTDTKTETETKTETNIKSDVVDDNTATVSSSCNHKEDGLYYIKPSESGNIIPVICSNGYTMLDMSLGYDSISTYFTSMYKYGTTDKVIYGTDCGDSGGWRDWFTPATKDTKFNVAINCLECTNGVVHGDNTGYYMTNGYFCPVDLDVDGCDPKALNHDLPEDVMCNVCDDIDGLCGSGEGRDGTLSGHANGDAWCDCYTLQLTADHLTTSEHIEYCQMELNWRPNVVIDRTQCTCYKPLDDDVVKYTNIQLSELPTVDSTYYDDIMSLDGFNVDSLIIWADADISTENKKACQKKTIYLNQDDFISGTYRITECGNYELTEDIVINFNKPDFEFSYTAGDSPNSYSLDNLYWFPTNEQQESGQYFGLNDFWGPYSIGFMAAITVETSHVYINLNGFTISMEYEFYLQQRFFAIIELGNKQFESRQGPVDFGRDDLCSKDIIIKNGILGLSSHHGIHGSCAKNVEILNLNIQYFDVGGFQCNGCQSVTIEGCDIGPQNIDIPVLGRYTHGRIVLSRLRYLVNQYGDETITFANRNSEEVTVRQLADTLIEQMDMIYYHIIQDIQFDDDDIQWITAKNTFLNPTGWMDGGSSYGILLNGYGTAVVNIGRRTGNTYDITVKNTKIHDISVAPYEGFWAATPVNSEAQDGSAIVHGFFFETIDWKRGNVYDSDSGIYLGDAYTDLLFASNAMFQTDFCPLGSLFYLDALTDWVFNDGVSLWNKNINIEFRCGSDIQSHSAKGAIALRIDGVQNFQIEDVSINNIQNWGDLGDDICGEYEKITFETGVDVDKDIQYGYTGTKVHAILTDYASGNIKNVEINNLLSHYGSVNAIAIYKGSQVNFDGDISINNVIAGSKLTQNQVNQLTLPNPSPFVCSIFIGPNSDIDTNPEYTPIVSTTNDLNVIVKNMYGYDYCNQETRVGDMDTPDIPYNTNFNVINGISSHNNFSFNNNSFILLILSIFIVIIIIMIMKFRTTKAKKLNKTNKKTKQNYGSFDNT